VRRPIAVEAVGPSTLAVRAAGPGLIQAGLSPSDIDFIVFATMTPDVTFPGSGCFFQDQMGCDTVGALDVRAQCAGFLFGLVIADRFVRTGVYRRVLVAGAEVHSSGLDYSANGIDVARLYGDGAGVAVVGDGKGPGLRASRIRSNGRHHRDFWCEYPASRQHPLRMTVENFRENLHFPKIAIDRVRRFGEESLTTVIEETLDAAALGAKQIDRFVITHLLPEVSEVVGQRLGIEPSRLDIPASRHGHLTAAALPVALSEGVASGALGPGATVCLAASGAGFCWGAVVLSL
jgi:3-oxoacyl-[acyl-carrier-protein] synthase III